MLIHSSRPVCAVHMLHIELKFIFTVCELVQTRKVVINKRDFWTYSTVVTSSPWLKSFILSTAILLVSKKQHAPLPSLLPFKNITDLNFLVGMIWEKNQNQNFRAYTLNLHFYVLILINIIFFNLLYRHYGKYFLPGSSKSSSNLITQKVKDTSACPTMLSWKEYRILSNLTNKKYPVFYILWSISVTFWICLSVIFLTAALTKDKNFV